MARKLVEHGDRLSRRQLVRVTPARRRQAVDAGEVAGVGQLPGQADRGVEPALEVVGERGRCLAAMALERQTAGVMAVRERPEALGPPAEQVIAQRSVHPTHAVDRDLLDDQLVLDQLLVGGVHRLDGDWDRVRRHGRRYSRRSRSTAMPAQLSSAATALTDDRLVAALDRGGQTHRREHRRDRVRMRCVPGARTGTVAPVVRPQVS